MVLTGRQIGDAAIVGIRGGDQRPSIAPKLLLQVPAVGRGKRQHHIGCRGLRSATFRAKQRKPAFAHGKLLTASALVEGNGVPTRLPLEDPTLGLLRILGSLRLGDQSVGVIAVEGQPRLGARTVRTGQDSLVGAGPIERTPAVVRVGRLRGRTSATLPRSSCHSGRYSKKYDREFHTILLIHIVPRVVSDCIA